MVDYEWKIKPADPKNIDALHASLKINKALCRTLVSRDIFTFEEAKKYFRPDINDTHNPFLMKDMDKATNRIINAINENEKVRVYGDYDVDGTTAVAVVTNFLKKNHPNPDFVTYYIPNRYTEGYGLSQKGIDDSISAEATLLIVLDCGIKSVDKIDYANTKGLDVIVCDHHLPDEVLPAAFAILNPKQNDCEYPYKELSGCGIGYKLICALAEKLDCSDEMRDSFLDLVAASIASDIVPMTGENRVLAFHGLKKANENPSLPISILKNVAGVLDSVSIMKLVFIIGPRINAAGRMNDANKVVDFFLEKDENVALTIAESLQIDNKERKEMDSAITSEALAFIEEKNLQSNASFVLHNETWHKGVIGIVASRVIETYYKPTIILTTSSGIVTGSARSVHGFDIHNAISKCEYLLESWGGHHHAAGVTMPIENLKEFIEKFEKIVSNTISEDSKTPKMYIDAEVKISDLTLNFLNIVEQMEPCGPQNPAPIFLIKEVIDTGFSRVAKDIHLQLSLTQNGRDKIKGIAFNSGDKFALVQSGKQFDIVAHVERNVWNGQSSVQLRILDMKFSH